MCTQTLLSAGRHVTFQHAGIRGAQACPNCCHDDFLTLPSALCLQLPMPLAPRPVWQMQQHQQRQLRETHGVSTRPRVSGLERWGWGRSGRPHLWGQVPLVCPQAPMWAVQGDVLGRVAQRRSLGVRGQRTVSSSEPVLAGRLGSSANARTHMHVAW